MSIRVSPGTFRKPRSRATPMLRTIDRPTYATLRRCLTAASITCWTRCTWEAKQATMTRCFELANTRSSTGEISRSRVVKPGTSELVESTQNRSTPSSPSRANARRSVIRLSSGSWSILKSPVCSTIPAPVRIATTSASGIEWFTATNSHSNGPKVMTSPSLTTICGTLRCRCSFSFASSSASVSWDPTSGMSGRSRSRYGTAPMWSSWPCVSTSAATSSSRSRIGSKSGRIRSTPGWFSSGNSTPQSTISSWPSYSKTVMLRPTSPSPPSGITRSAPGASGPGAVRSGCGWLTAPPRFARRLRSPLAALLDCSLRSREQTRRLEVRGQPVELLGGDLNQRQPGRRVLQDPRELQRALGRDGALDPGHDRLDRDRQPAVDLAGLGQVTGVDGVDHRAVVRTGHVPDHAHHAGRAHRQPGQVHLVGDAPRVLGERDQRLRGDLGRGARRHVVQHHVQAGRVGDGREVRLHALLRR